MSKKLLWSIGIIIFFIFVFGISYLFFYNQPSRQQESGISLNEPLVSPLFETKEWAGLAGGYPGGISLRATLGNNESLLLKHNNKDIVYRYDLVTKQLQLVNTEIWTKTTSEIINCNSQVGKESWRTRIDRKTNKLLMDNSEVQNIKGSTHLYYQFSSRSDKLAVLSASGKKSSSPMPFLGEGGASGAHYNQVFSFPKLTPIGSAVELPFTTEKVTFGSCWSADNKFVVYFDALNSKLAIVEVK